MKEKIKKLIIICLLLIILIIGLIVALKLKTYYNRKRANQIMGINIDEEKIKTLNYTNISNLSIVTTDDSNQINLAKKFENLFKNEIPTISEKIEEFSDEKINQYYDKNMDYIKKKFFNMEKEEFYKLCKKIKVMTVNLNSDYDVCDFSISDDKNSVYITCTYINNEKIVLNLSKDKELKFVE